jgi:hypothetical protein
MMIDENLNTPANTSAAFLSRRKDFTPPKPISPAERRLQIWMHEHDIQLSSGAYKDLCGLLAAIDPLMQATITVQKDAAVGVSSYSNFSPQPKDDSRLVGTPGPELVDTRKPIKVDDTLPDKVVEDLARADFITAMRRAVPGQALDRLGNGEYVSVLTEMQWRGFLLARTFYSAGKS